MAQLNKIDGSISTVTLASPVDSLESHLSSDSHVDAVEETFVLPASREQTRYWMLAQLDPTSTASNMAIAFDIKGEIRADLAEAAIAALTMRHEALRTIFRLEAGVLSQVILDRPLYSFKVDDLSSLTEDLREKAAETVVSQHGHTLIDLHSGPVLHARLIHLDRHHHILALTMNHIVCDGWSNGILIRDFTCLYEAKIANKEADLPELPFQFADFALWQQEYLNSPEAEKAADFWKSRVTKNLTALDLPTDYARAAGRSFPGHIESALLPDAVNVKLVEYCRNSGSTKHIVLLAAFEALCARYTGQTEFLLGSTIANRTQPGMENVVGRFANPQIITAQVDGDPTFADLERLVREKGAEAYNHQDLPFSRIIEDFQIDQAGATSQFLQVWFLYQKAFMQPQEGATILVKPRRSVSGGVDFDLLVSIVERAEGPRIQMEYNTQLFSPDRIRALISSFISMLGDALADPSQPLSALAHNSPILSSNDGFKGSSESAPPSSRDFIFEHLRMAATSLSHTVAVVDESSSLSWNDLDVHSSAVAAELKRRHASSESILVVVLEDSAASVVALIAALKTGARVLPLPGHANASHVQALLTKLPQSLLLAPRTSSPHGASAHLFLDEFYDLPRPASFESEGTAKLLFLTDAASATFESVSIRGVMESLKAVADRIGLNYGSIDSGESILALPAATPFEACLDRLMAVASGSQLNFVRELSAESIDQVLARHQITRMLLCPVDLRKLTKGGWKGDRRVSLVLRGGRLPILTDREADDRLPRHYQSAVYLLSEPSLGGYVAFQKFSPGTLAAGLAAVRGTISVRDQLDRPVPTGAFGRLHLDNVGVDFMARSRTDGIIEAMDRRDRFVQLRGHRICLGEIEDALRLLSAVEDSFTAVVETEGDASLIAYIVSKASLASGTERPNANAHLSTTLPSHMVPAEYIWLDKLPLMLDGRVDSSALPKTAVSHTAYAEAANTGMTAIEEKLAGIWKDVLSLRHVDVHTPFFEAGGSSLLLVRLFARINKAFDTSLPITAIFEAKTIAALAMTLGGESHTSPLVQVQTGGNKPPLFMIHSYLLYKGLSTSLGSDQPFYGLRELDREGHLTIEERVIRYVSEIRKVQAHGPYHLAGWCAAGPLTVEVARQFILAGEEINYIALFDSWLPGYLESIQSEKPVTQRLPFREVSRKLSYHRRKMADLKVEKKVRYVWMASARILRETRYRLYLKNWERLRRLSEKVPVCSSPIHAQHKPRYFCCFERLSREEAADSFDSHTSK